MPGPPFVPDRPPRRRRILAIWLTALAIDRWRLAEGSAEGRRPLALLSRDRPRPADCRRSTPLRAVPGCAPGAMLADARALCPDLAVHPAIRRATLHSLKAGAVGAALGAVVGARSARWPAGRCHRRGAPVRRRARTARRCRRAAGGAWAKRRALAIAPTAGAAWALAHYGPGGAVHDPGDGLATSFPLPRSGSILQHCWCCAGLASSG
jgi:protein ImuB